MKHYYAEYIVNGQFKKTLYYFRSRMALANYIQDYHGFCTYLKIELI